MIEFQGQRLRDASHARPYEQVTDQLNEPEDGRRIEPPRCRHCNGKARPGVVWFGESLPEQAWREALAAVRNCDLLLSAGTSGLVQPAADIPRMAREHGAVVVHVNLQRESVQGEREFSLVGKTAEILPRLLAQANELRASSTVSGRFNERPVCRTWGGSRPTNHLLSPGRRYLRSLC